MAKIRRNSVQSQPVVETKSNKSTEAKHKSGERETKSHKSVEGKSHSPHHTSHKSPGDQPKHQAAAQLRLTPPRTSAAHVKSSVPESITGKTVTPLVSATSPKKNDNVAKSGPGSKLESYPTLFPLEQAVFEEESDAESADNSLLTMPHHAHEASLYGPIPELERLMTKQHQEHLAHQHELGFDEDEGSLTFDTEAGDQENHHHHAGSGRKKALRWIKKKCGQMSDISEEDRIDAVGEWDYWKGYYCSQHPLIKKYNANYFAWILLFSVGQCSMINLIHYIWLYGSAFLVITFFTYCGIGYPLFLLETAMGQYSGRKPLQMLRHLCPIFSGLGILLYFRTFLLTLRAEAIFLYSLVYALDLYFCQINANEFFFHFYEKDMANTTFILGKFSTPDIYHFHKILLLGAFLVTIFVAGTLNIHTLGKAFSIGIKMILVTHVIYFLVILQRVIDSTAVGSANQQNGTTNTNENATLSPSTRHAGHIHLNETGPGREFSPTENLLYFHWDMLFNGRAWIDSVIYVIASLSCGTLVHPYLGSRSFFHYRTIRDGILLIICKTLWNLSAIFSIVMWLNYTAISTAQIHAAYSQMGGPYGLFIVYVLKLNQAQLTKQVESDVLFFTGIFYTTVAALALLTLNAYLHILIHCSYPEKTSVGAKLLIFIFVSLFFSIVAPLLLITKEGLQHLIWIDYYVNHFVPVVIFVVGCFFWSVAYGHSLTKFVYDFRNMMHFEIFGASRVSAKYSKFLRLLVSVAIVLILIYSIVLRQYPTAGQTDYSGTSAYIGVGIQSVLCLVVIVIALFVKFSCKGFTGRSKDNKRPTRPHRDWFKNRFHYKVCFIQRKTEESVASSDSSADTESADEDESVKELIKPQSKAQ